MNSIETLQSLFGQVCLINNRPEALPGISREEVLSAFNKIGLAPPELLVNLYQWHNGIWDLNGTVSFLPLTYAISLYESYHGLKTQFAHIGWEPTWFPVMDLNADVQLCVDVDSGELIATDMECDHFHVVAASYKNLIVALSMLFDKKAYRFNEKTGTIEADQAVWRALGHKHCVHTLDW